MLEEIDIKNDPQPVVIDKINALIKEVNRINNSSEWLTTKEAVKHTGRSSQFLTGIRKNVVTNQDTEKGKITWNKASLDEELRKPKERVYTLEDQANSQLAELNFLKQRRAK